MPLLLVSIIPTSNYKVVRYYIKVSQNNNIRNNVFRSPTAQTYNNCISLAHGFYFVRRIVFHLSSQKI